MEESNLVQEQQTDQQPKDSRSGMAVRVIVIVSALLLVAGGIYGAYWYGQEQASKENEAKVAELQSQIDSIKAEAKDTAPNLDDANDGYLVIKQWGVKFKYNGDPTGLRYAIESNDGTEMVQFASTELTKMADSKDSENFCDGGSLGMMIKSNTKPATQAGANNSGQVAVIDDTYYSYSFVQNACSMNKDVQAEQLRQQGVLAEQLKTLVKAE